MAQAQREEGWPLGLHPLNARIGLVRNRNFSGSVSFSTWITASPSSSCISSSDLDTESTGSFFHDKSITLGSLIGISSFLELSRRSTRRRTTETSRDQKKYSYNKSRPWLFSLCSKLNTDAVDSTNNGQSLGHFLQVERRSAATNNCTRNQTHADHGPGDFSPVVMPTSEPNSLFVGDQIAPRSDADGRKSDRQLLEHGNGYGVTLLLSCCCRQLI